MTDMQSAALSQGEYQDFPGLDFVTPIEKKRASRLLSITVGGPVLLGFIIGLLGGGLGGALVGAFWGLMLGGLIYVGASLLGIEEATLRKREDGINTRNAKRKLSVDENGEVVLESYWMQPPRTDRFNLREVRAVEIARMVDFDDELGRVNAHNASISAKRDSRQVRRLNDETDRIAKEWVVYATLSNGGTVDCAHRQSREQASKAATELQRALRGAGQNVGQAQVQRAQHARAVGLANDGDAPL